jgi:hypothetical protein
LCLIEVGATVERVYSRIAGSFPWWSHWREANLSKLRCRARQHARTTSAMDGRISMNKAIVQLPGIGETLDLLPCSHYRHRRIVAAVSVAGMRFKSSRWVRASLQPATLLGLVVIVACWFGVVVELELERGKTMDAAVQQSANLASLFEVNTVRTFEGVDRTLLLLREAYERDPKHFDLRDWSRRTALLGEFTLQLTLIGSDGYTVDPTDVPGGRRNAPISVTAIILAPRSMPRPTSFSSARR